MSDSELSDVPTNDIQQDAELERSLRQTVVKADESGQEATVNSIRTASEKQLGLQSGFYNNHGTWKARSKEIIRDQFEKQQAAAESAEKKPEPPSKTEHPQKVPAKRPSPAPSPRPRKKSKPSTTNDNAKDSDALSTPPESDEEDRKASKKSAGNGQAPKSASPAAPPAVQQDSDSELSSLIDDEPPPKKRTKSKEKVSDKPKKSSSAKAAPSTNADPDQEEIKRLQGWLVKCGIRKVWGKELKPFDTPKAKIKHLKQMLTDAGMTGRYSNEKASQIKEARELAADIEAVQEGNQRWGKDDDDGADDDEKPRARRLIRGSKHYDFLSSDGEETD